MIRVYLCSGDGQSFDVSEIVERVNILRNQIGHLERDEQRLDKDKLIVDHYIKQITEDLANQKYCSLTSSIVLCVRSFVCLLNNQLWTAVMARGVTV